MIKEEDNSHFNVQECIYKMSRKSLKFRHQQIIMCVPIITPGPLLLPFELEDCQVAKVLF